MHPAFAHGRERRPQRIVAHGRGEVGIDRDDDVGIPQQHLLERHHRKAAGAVRGHVARAEKLDRFHVDRAAEPGFQSTRAAGVVNARPGGRRDFVHPFFDRRHRLLGIAREGFGLIRAMRQLAELAIGRHDCRETAVEQRVGNFRLLLHARCERDECRIGRPDIENEVGLERKHGFEVGRVAAAGEPADFRPRAHIGQHELAFLRAIGARPADEDLGCERVEEDGGGRAGGEYAGDRIGNWHGTAGRIDDFRGARGRRRNEARRAGEQHAPRDHHVRRSYAGESLAQS
jgi:hypothetical protein